jgi:predicted RNA-binding Zn-ribbon protein involved in translation (DUF1610 family)
MPFECPHCGKEIRWQPGNPCSECGGRVISHYHPGITGQGREAWMDTDYTDWTCEECGETMKISGYERQPNGTYEVV